MSAVVIVRRLATGVHLPEPGNSLFTIARLTAFTVIYNIIAITMKTFSSTDQLWNISQIGDRSILILAGIMTAIICSMVFLHDTYSSEQVTTTLGLGEHWKILQTEVAVDIKKVEVASAVLRFR
jgi:uncharacterized membrane protein